MLRLRIANDFEVGLSSTLPPLGSKSRGLRVISESWSSARDRLELEVSGTAGEQYELPVWNPAQVSAVDGAELVRRGPNEAQLRVRVPDDAATPIHTQMLCFTSRMRVRHKTSTGKQAPVCPHSRALGSG
jgi:hypothetical protein